MKYIFNGEKFKKYIDTVYGILPETVEEFKLKADKLNGKEVIKRTDGFEFYSGEYISSEFIEEVEE